VYVNDQPMIKGAIGGDAQAFTKLYNLHHKYVYNVIFSMVRNEEQAEDLAQDTFLKVYRKLSQFQGNSQLATWIYRVAVNVVLQWRRDTYERQVAGKRVKRPVPMSLEDLLVSQAEDYDLLLDWPLSTRDTKLDGTIDRLTIQKAVKSLPSGCRDIFILRELEGLEYNEVADIMGCTKGTCRTQVNRARKKLKSILTRRSDA
jgi:RNA polymerase sigma-70 factor (ECF subfamily)